jgi:ribosomal protein S10
MAAAANKIRIRLKAFDHQLLDKSSNDIVEMATDAHLALHRPSWSPRRQEIARAIRDSDAQASSRHSRANPTNA